MTYIDYRHRVEFGDEEYARHRRVRPRARHRLVRLALGRRVGRLPRAVRRAGPQGRLGLADRRRAAPRGCGPPAARSSCPPACRPRGRSGTRSRCWAATTSCSATPPAPTRRKPSELNLRMIHTLQAEFPNVPIGYSGHEIGLQTTLAAVALGATFVERHITLDRAMWGSDQAASVEPPGLQRLVRDIRTISESLGDGVKKVYDGELAAMKKLRRVPESPSWSGPPPDHANRRPGREPGPAAERGRVGAPRRGDPRPGRHLGADPRSQDRDQSVAAALHGQAGPRGRADRDLARGAPRRAPRSPVRSGLWPEISPVSTGWSSVTRSRG